MDHMQRSHNDHARHPAHSARRAAERDAAPANRETHSMHSHHNSGPAATARTGQHSPATWRMAALATLHCLTGCAVGEVIGMVIGTALNWNNLPTMVLAIVLAFVFGYGLTIRGVLQAGVAFGAALSIALAADTVSITVMEITDNAVLLLVPGAMHAGLADALFWGSLAFSFIVAFLVTTPVNRWLISRGKGHAVVHTLQGHH